MRGSKSYRRIIMLCLLLGITTETSAQVFEKLIRKVIEKDVAADSTSNIETGKKRSDRNFRELMGEIESSQDFESTKKNTFVGWPYGRGDIFLVTANRQSVHSGYIFEDGFFTAMFPDENVDSHMLAGEFVGKKCENQDEAIISNPKAKLAMGTLAVVTKGEFTGGLVRASSMTKARNVFNRGGEGVEGVAGDYHYIYVYTTKATQIKCDCQWQRDITEEGLEAVDRLDYDLEKGWNLVKVTLVKTHQIENKRFFIERRFETVPTALKETPWYFIHTKAN
ncbi:MAG: hypothetical protein AAF039_07345 [Bacteroidota bacterium]